jgi:threonine/homoserine/homoserine lactone efflux protein
MNVIDFAAQVIFISVSGVLSPGPLFFANLIYGSKEGFYSGVKIASGHTIVELLLVISLAAGLFGFSSFKLTSESIRIIWTGRRYCHHNFFNISNYQHHKKKKKYRCR